MWLNAVNQDLKPLKYTANFFVILVGTDTAADHGKTAMAIRTVGGLS